MHRTFAVLTGVVLSGLAATAAFSPSSANAGAASPLATQMPAQTSALQQVQFWDVGRCRAWRRECADRWGWRTGRWYRCLARHGCERHRYGDRWD
jgi:hypothetical protein